MYPKNLIVNADDFGVEINISRGIHKCVSDGLVNSISIITFEDRETQDMLIDIRDQYPGVKLGCHLALFDIPQKYTVAQLSAVSFRTFLLKYFMGKVSSAGVYDAWELQLERLIAMGMKINHLDSHQHLHVLPGLWQCVEKLQKKFDIPYIRVPYETIAGSLPYQFPFGFFFQSLAWFRAQKFPDRNFIGFLKSMNFNFEFYRNKFQNVLEFPDQHFELMVHPGYSPGQSDEGAGTWVAAWESEIKELEKVAQFFEKERSVKINK